MVNEVMKCKTFFNHTICKVKNDPGIYSIPNVTIPMEVVTSSSCMICKDAVNEIMKTVVKPLKDILKVNVIDIDRTTRNVSQYDLVMPSFHVAGMSLGNNPNSQDVLRAIQKSFQR